MATQTITTTGAEDTRILEAFGNYLRLAGNATAAQVKAAQIDWVRTIVRDYEKRKAILALVPAADIAPT